MFGHRPGSIYQAEEEAHALTGSDSSNGSTIRKVASAIGPTLTSPLDEGSASTGTAGPHLGWAEKATQAVIVGTFLLVCFTFLDGSLFSWHPVLMTLGFVGAMSQGVITAINFRLTEGEQRVSAIQKHASWQVAALISIAVAFYCIFENKVAHGKSHFTSLHSRVGAATLICAVIVPLGGAVAFRKLGLLQRLPEAVRPQLKWAHRRAGAATWFLACATILLGLRQPTVYHGALTWALQLAVIALVALMAYRLRKSPAGQVRDQLDAASKLV